MGGDHEELLRWRREIRAGSRVGPRMFIAGPYLEAASRVERMRKDPPSERIEPFERLRIPIGSPDDARRVIGELAKKEVDYIKIRTVQDNDTYLALNEAAHANKLRLTGHVPTGMDPEFVLKAGQDDIEHGFFPPLKIASRDERLALWRKFAARGTVVVPTMVVIKDERAGAHRSSEGDDGRRGGEDRAAAAVRLALLPEGLARAVGGDDAGAAEGV